MATILNFFMQNNYGLIPQNFTNHNTIIDADGKLIVGYQHNWAGLDTTRVTIGTDATSTTTTTMDTGSNRDRTGLELQGPIIDIFNCPKWSDPKYLAVIGESQSLSSNSYIYSGVLADDGSITWTLENEAFSDDIVYDVKSCSACDNCSLWNFCTDSADADLLVNEYSIVSTAIDASETAEQSYYYYPIMAAYARGDGTAGVVCAIGDETLTNISDFAFTIFDGTAGSFSTPTELGLDWATSDYVENVDIAYDPYNDVIGIITSRWDNSESELVFEFSYSDDGGSTFTTEEITTGGSDDFTGSISTEVESHVSITSGVEGGFIIGYTRLNSSSVARPFIHIVSKDASGSGYTIGAAKECGQSISKWDATTSMIGPLFFKAPAEMDTNIDPAELVYIAYQIDEGIQIWANYPQGSYKSIGIIIERLDEVALATSSSSYSDQTSDAGEMVIDVNILESPTETMDYYSAGWTGDQTTKYANAFSQHGTTITVEKYEPRDDVYLTGRAAYGSATTSLVKAFFEAESWAVATQGLNSSDFSEYINRDLRKLYLPPSFYMSSSTNDSRSYISLSTVWLAKFDGYVYQIRQLVPHFVKDQIVYWEANCYNVGNYDVWSSGGGL